MNHMYTLGAKFRRFAFAITLMCCCFAFGAMAQVTTPIIRPIEIRDNFESEKYAGYEKVRVTDYAPTLVCTAADKNKLKGGRFITGGPCLRHIQEAIPNNNSPAYDCEKANGKDNCVLIEIKIPGSDYVRQVYIKKAPEGFEYYWESLGYELGEHSEVTSWSYRLYHARSE